MSIDSVVLHLKIGSASDDAPPALMRALQRVEVTQTDQAPSGFQLTFHVEKDDASAADFALVAGSLLQPFQRVVVMVVVNGHRTILMDGFITHQQFAPSERPGGSKLVVTGEDVSIKMDMIEISFEYPAMTDALIAEAVLAKYLLIGISPDVSPSVESIVPFGYVPQQNSTDRAFLQQLAQQNGAIFYVTPGSSPGKNTAYWGPPRLGDTPQDPLTGNMGPYSNVESISFDYDYTKPYFVYGYVMETSVDPYIPVPVVTLSSTRTPQLAQDPALDPSRLVSLSMRKKLWQDQGMDPIKSLAVAQGMTDLSTDDVVTAQGRLDVTRYGNVLTAPGVVPLRGCGLQYDGLYYVKTVQHEIDVTTGGDWSYAQSFTLTRDGVGSTIDRLPQA